MRTKASRAFMRFSSTAARLCESFLWDRRYAVGHSNGVSHGAPAVTQYARACRHQAPPKRVFARSGCCARRGSEAVGGGQPQAEARPAAMSSAGRGLACAAVPSSCSGSRAFAAPIKESCTTTPATYQHPSTLSLPLQTPPSQLHLSIRPPHISLSVRHATQPLLPAAVPVGNTTQPQSR